MTALYIIGVFAGMALMLGSAFYLFAIGMSDSPGTGNPRGGCFVMVVGAVISVAAVVALIVRWAT